MQPVAIRSKREYIFPRFYCHTKPTMTFAGRTAIVTGASGALGRVVAKKFFDAGANIALPVRSSAAVRSLTESFGTDSARILVAECNLESEESVGRFVEIASERFRRVDALANIAGGYTGGKTVAETPPADFERMWGTNVRTMLLMSRAVVGSMLRSGAHGRIVSIGAMPALTSGAKRGAYALSKRAVIALTEIIADEVRGSGITANVIVPGILRTEANLASMPQADTSKWVTPEEVADVILFLCSEQARSINGTVIKMFGGL